jgi:hypothetical protein
MIVKKIGRKTGARGGGAEHRYAVVLTRYIARAGAEEIRALAELSDDAYILDLAAYAVRNGSSELVRDSWALNLQGEDVEDWQAELYALRFRAGHPQDITDHWVLSWDQADEPTNEEVSEAVDLFLRCERLEGCPVVAAIHEDTSNVHVHLCVTRLDCVTAKRTLAGQGWDIDAAHRAKAIIEDRFPDWRREEGSLYRVIDGRLVDVERRSDIGPADEPSQWRVRMARGNRVPETEKQFALDQSSRRFEAETGLKSLRRVAWEEAVPVLRGASSWPEVHRQLAQRDIGLKRTRAGGLLCFGEKTVKLSVCRDTSFAKLEQRLGKFEPPIDRPGPWQPREIHAPGSEEARYYAAKRAFDARRAGVASQLQRLQKALGAGANLSAAGRANVLAAYAFPSIADWRAGIQPSDPLQALMEAETDPCIRPAGFLNTVPTPIDIEGYLALPRRKIVVYRPIDNPTRVAITDIGSTLVVHDSHDPGAVRAALLIAAGKWPDEVLEFEGDARFVQVATRIARELNIQVAGATDIEQRTARPEPTRVVPSLPMPRQVAPMIPRPVEAPKPAPLFERDGNTTTTGPGPTEPDLYLSWLRLRHDEEQRGERERLALCVVQDEAALRHAQTLGHAKEIQEQAQARGRWLSDQAERARRGWGR